MREIKFRVFDESEKEMYYLLEDRWSFGPCEDVRAVSWEDVFAAQEPDLIPLQYTGLKDKNDVEIYEGDLYIGKKEWCDGYLKKKYPKVINVICEVVFGSGKFYGKVIGSVDEHKEAYENNDYRLIHYTLETHGTQNKRIEVIGNVYENPELIKDEFYS